MFLPLAQGLESGGDIATLIRTIHTGQRLLETVGDEHERLHRVELVEAVVVDRVAGEVVCVRGVVTEPGLQHGEFFRRQFAVEVAGDQQLDVGGLAIGHGLTLPAIRRLMQSPSVLRIRLSETDTVLAVVPSFVAIWLGLLPWL